MRSFSVGLCAIALVSLSAFGQEPSLPNPVLNPGTPWAFWGFVVNTPDAPDILSQSKSAGAANLGKKLPEPDHTVAFTVVSHKLEKEVSGADELLAILKESRGKKSDPSRFRIVEYKEEIFVLRDYWCTRYSMLNEDRGVRTFGSVPLVIEGITCVHPDRRDFAVDVGYSERAAGKEVSPELREIGEKFIRSLRFLPLPDRDEIRGALEALRAKEGEKALALLKPLLDKGDSQAALIAGEIYLLGHGGVPINYAAARQMLEVAAQDGHVDALYNLGSMYDRAQGVPRDPVEAIKWFKLAADQRDNVAQFNLAVLYGRGDGVPRDRAEAEKWGRMAADNGNEHARQILRGR
jgi:Sel1 repeat-containing protein